MHGYKLWVHVSLAHVFLSLYTNKYHLYALRFGHNTLYASVLIIQNLGDLYTVENSQK